MKKILVTIAALLMAVQASATLWVSTGTEGEIKEYRESTGEFVGNVATDLNDVTGMAMGTDGRVYVSITGDSSIYRYSVDGTRDTSFRKRTADSPRGITFNPANGDLYYANIGNESVYKGTPGGSDKRFGVGWFRQYRKGDVSFGPDGKVYVTRPEGGKRQILSRPADMSAPWAVVATFAGGDSPNNMAWDASGNLYVTGGRPDNNGDHFVKKIDVSTGAVTDFVPLGSAGLSAPEDLAFGPDGNLYVMSTGTSKVLRYNGTTGAYMDVFVSGVCGDHLLFVTENR